MACHPQLGLSTVFLILLAFAPRAMGDSPRHRTLFLEGLDAEESRRWGVAAAYFNEALLEKSEEGEWFPSWYGERTVFYLPRFHLGSALFELGRLDEAFELWGQALRQGKLGRKELGALEKRSTEDFATICRQKLRWARQEVEAAETLGRQAAGQIDGLSPQLKIDPSWTSSLRQKELALAAERQVLDEIESHCALRKGGASTLDLLSTARRVANEIETTIERSMEARADLSRLKEELERQANADAEARSAAFKRLAAEIVRRLEAAGPAPRPPGPPTMRRGLRFTARSTQEPEPVWHPTERAIRDYVAAYLELDHRGCTDRATLEAAVRTLELEPDFGQPGTTSSSNGIPYEPEWSLARAAMYCGDRDAALGFLKDGNRVARLSKPQRTRLEEWIALSAPLDRVETKRFALLLGGQSYRRYKQSLPETSADLLAIREALERQGFRLPDDPKLGPQPHIDKTKEQILELADRFFKTHGQEPEATLIVYWVGHGETRKVCVEKRQCPEDKPRYDAVSYILPFDYRPMPSTEATTSDKIIHWLDVHAVEMTTLLQWATGTAKLANHILFVLDSCSSGMLIDGLEPMPDLFSRQTAMKPVRMFIASGIEDRPVSASSEFRKAFVDAIEGCADDDGEKDLHVTGVELGEYLRERLYPTQRARLAGRRGPSPYNLGDFVFEVPAPPKQCDEDVPAKNELANLDLAMEIYARFRHSQTLEQLLEGHLKNFPERHFQEVIRRIRRRLGLNPPSPSARATESTPESSGESRALPHPQPR